MKLLLLETGQKHMGQTNKFSNKKNNAELSIQIGLSGLSFCILQKNTNTITFIKEVNFKKRLNPFEVLNELKLLFNTEEALQNSFSNICIIHDNELSTLVPKTLFKEDALADYLKLNTKILKSDFITYDDISINNSANVYVPYININNFIFDKFGSFTFKHVSTVLIESILKIEKNTITPKVYLNISSNHFEIIATNNSKLLLYNSFKYTSKEDFIYYTLFTTEQLNLNPDELNLILIGNVVEGDDLYNIAYKYIRNISFGDSQNNYMFTKKNRPKYSSFTLINSF